jgi:uncharacterized protein (DUF433 family)
MTDIQTEIVTLRFATAEIQQKTQVIYAATLRESRHIRAGNFDAIAAADVERLFHAYDEAFFDGLFPRLLKQEDVVGLTFRISPTMTSAGGKTKYRHQQVRSPGGVRTVTTYELAVSAPLLFQTFREEGHSATVVGLPCADRLEALQRIVEHELIHLLELLVWRDSSCSRERFQRLAANLFAHTASKHQLVTQYEIAHQEYGIKVGDRVTFDYEGVRHTGTVNRITKRVTVLVEDPRGTRYSNGKHYLKFYVPLPMLERAEQAQAVADTGAVSGIRLDAGGVAWIAGTTTRVIDLVLRKQASGASPEAVRVQMPHLSLAQVYAALAYYHAHQQTMDAVIAQQRRPVEAPRTPELPFGKWEGEAPAEPGPATINAPQARQAGEAQRGPGSGRPPTSQTRSEPSPPPREERPAHKKHQRGKHRHR